MELRPYQVDAISSWESNGFQGIWELATGTGKTFTAISATMRLYERLRSEGISLNVVVICPYINLVDQWGEAFRKIGWNPVMAYESRDSWTTSLHERQSWLALAPGSRSLTIATQTTFNLPEFQRQLKNFSGETLVIGDEVHNLGNARSFNNLPLKAKYRLGLSATPERYLDPEGTQRILDYFGDVIYRMELKEAILAGWLTPYRYLPRVVEMSSEETYFYIEISAKLAKVLAGRSLFDLPKSEAERAGKLIRLRSALIGGVSGKWEPFWEDLKSNQFKNSQLIYCAEGKSPLGSQSRQIDDVKEGIEARGFGSAEIYDATVKRESRRQILNNFDEHKLKYILSMRCLDEGVDLPNANVGYFLASSSNPRQFVQRRGRLLRKFENKHESVIFDYFVVPKMSALGDNVGVEKSLGKREVNRSLQFIDACNNQTEAMDKIKNMGDFYGL